MARNAPISGGKSFKKIQVWEDSKPQIIFDSKWITLWHYSQIAKHW